MLEVKDGKIYVEGVETIDPELIGFAFLDFAQELSQTNHEFNSEIIFKLINQTKYETKVF